MKFYHGTSSNAKVTTKLLPPDDHRFGINEEGRTIHSGKVFCTTSKGYARHYAKRACKRAGGTPVVYEVNSANPTLMSSGEGCDVYFDTELEVVSATPVNTLSSRVKRKQRKAVKNRMTGRDCP